LNKVGRHRRVIRQAQIIEPLPGHNETHPESTGSPKTGNPWLILSKRRIGLSGQRWTFVFSGNTYQGGTAKA
jgi:hypothetical protein